MNRVSLADNVRKKNKRVSNLGERIGGCAKKKKIQNEQCQFGRQTNVRKKKRIIRKTKQKECTTLASGLGVVQRRKGYKMNSVGLVSGRVRKKRK